jgi:hypothetical protein
MPGAREWAALAVAACLFLAALPRDAARRPPPPRPLPGIGAVRARAIAEARARRPFCRLEDLERVAGIGEGTLRRLRPWLRVAPGASCAGRHPGSD